MLHLENVPSTFANGMEDGADAKKWWSTDEKNDCFDQQQIDEVDFYHNLQDFALPSLGLKASLRK